MRDYLSSLTDKIIEIVLYIVAGITPLLFLDKTTEFYDTPKLIFLIAGTVLLLGLNIFSWILKGKIVINKTPLDYPLLGLGVVILISTYLSATRQQAIYGDFPAVHGSAVAWITYILLYFVAVASLRGLSKIKNLLYVLYVSGTVIALVSILSFFNIFLPFDFAKGVNFTPTGSTFSTIALLIMLLPLPLVSILTNNKYFPLYVAVILSLLYSITIALIGGIPSYVMMLIVYALSLYATRKQFTKMNLIVYLASAAVVGLTLMLAYMPFAGNKLQQLETTFPKEVQLSLPISWKVSASSFRDAPFFGTGPSSYLFNFTAYKPVEFNLLNYWTFSFSTAYNEFLQILSTLGFFGFLALTIISIIVVRNSNKFLSFFQPNAHHTRDVVQLSLAISGLMGIILLLIHASTLVSITLTLIIFAALMMSQEAIRNRVTEMSMGIKASTSHDQQFDLLPVVIFILYFVGAVVLVIRGTKIVSADYNHRLALTQANKNGTLTYEYLQKSETLNPLVDTYRVDMAQTNFALANIIATQKGPTEENPQGSLTDQDRQTIQTLLSQSINEGRASVLLSPRSSRNWEVLASVYRNLTGVANNALVFSLDAYGKAIQRDPLNPALRLAVGNIYYSAQNYDLAIRFFTDAINLKPDYTVAYYSLALTYRDKGEYQNAQAVAEQALSLIKKDASPADYQTVSDLIDYLKAKISADAQAAAEAEGAAIDQVEGVDVSGDLNNPPKVSTPAAVKKNPEVDLP